MGEQQLGGMQAVLHEGSFINFDQPGLADGCRRLFFVHGFRPATPAQALHATGNGTGRNQDDLFAGCAQLGNLPGPVADGAEIKAVTVVGDEGGADFDDQTFGMGETGW